MLRPKAIYRRFPWSIAFENAIIYEWIEQFSVFGLIRIKFQMAFRAITYSSVALSHSIYLFVISLIIIIITHKRLFFAFFFSLSLSFCTQIRLFFRLLLLLPALSSCVNDQIEPIGSVYHWIGWLTLVALFLALLILERRCVCLAAFAFMSQWMKRQRNVEVYW